MSVSEVNRSLLSCSSAPIDRTVAVAQSVIVDSTYLDTPQSRFFHACKEAGLVDDRGKWIDSRQISLPHLSKDERHSIFNTLKTTLHLKSKSINDLPERKRESVRSSLRLVKAHFEQKGLACPITYNEQTDAVSFKVNVPLKGLLMELMEKSPVEIESVQLIGGALPSTLGVNYYKKAFESLKKSELDGLLSDQTFANIEIPPVDLDIRFNVPKATAENLSALSRIALEYIVKRVSEDGEIKEALYTVIKELGLTNAAQLRPRDGSLVQFDLISFGNLGEQLDLVFCQHIPVTKLFNCHGLSVSIDSLITKSSQKECKGSLKLEYTKGWQALFDAVMGHLDVENSETNYHQGWSKFISFVTRGKACLNPDLKECLTTQSQVSPKDILRAFPFADDSYACIPLIINSLVISGQELSDIPLQELFRDWGISFYERKDSLFLSITGEIVSNAREAGLTSTDLITFLQVLAYQQISLKQDSGIDSIFCRVENTLGKPVMAIDIPYLKWRLSYCVPLITDETFGRFIALMSTPKKHCFERLFEIIVSQPLLKGNVEKRSLNELFIDSNSFVEPLSDFGSYGVVLSFLLQKSKPLGAYTHKFLSTIAAPIPEVIKRKLLEVYLQKTVEISTQGIIGKGFFFNGFGAHTKDELYFILVKDLLQSREEAFTQLAMGIWIDSKSYTLSEEVKRFAVNTMYSLGVRKKNIRICLDVLESCLTKTDYDKKVDLLAKLSKEFDHNSFNDRNRKRVVALVYELVEGATNQVLKTHKDSLSSTVRWIAVITMNRSFDGAFVDLISKAKDKKLMVGPICKLEGGFYELLSMSLKDEVLDILKVVKLFEDGKRCGLFTIEKMPEEYLETLITIAERCYESGHVSQFESFVDYLDGKSLGEEISARRAALVSRYIEDVLPNIDTETLNRMVAGKYSGLLSTEQKRGYRYRILERSIDKNMALGREVALEMLSENVFSKQQREAVVLYLEQLNRAVVGKANLLVIESIKILKHRNCGNVLTPSERSASLLKCFKLTDPKDSEQKFSLLVEALKEIGEGELEILEAPIEEAFKAVQNQRSKTKGQQEFIETLRVHCGRFISFYHRNNQPETLLTFIKNCAFVGIREPHDEQTFLIIVEALAGPKYEEVSDSVFMPSLQDSNSSSVVPRPPFADAHCDLGCNIPVLRISEMEQKDDASSKGSAAGLRSKGLESHSPGRSERQRTEAWVMPGKKIESCKDGIKNSYFLQSFHVYLITNFKLLIGNIDNENCFNLFCMIGDGFVSKEPEKTLQWISLCTPYESVSDGVLDKCFEWMGAIVQKDKKFTLEKLMPFLKNNSIFLSKSEFDFCNAILERCLEAKSYSDACSILKTIRSFNTDNTHKKFLDNYTKLLLEKILSDQTANSELLVDLLLECETKDIGLYIAVAKVIKNRGNSGLAGVFCRPFFEILKKQGKSEEGHTLFREIICKYSPQIAAEIICSNDDFLFLLQNNTVKSERFALIQTLRTVSFGMLKEAPAILKNIWEVSQGLLTLVESEADYKAYIATESLFIKTLLNIDAEHYSLLATKIYRSLIEHTGEYSRYIEREELIIRMLESFVKVKKNLEEHTSNIIYFINELLLVNLETPKKLVPVFQKIYNIEIPKIRSQALTWVLPICKAFAKETVKKDLSKCLEQLLEKTVDTYSCETLFACLTTLDVTRCLSKRALSIVMSKFICRKFFFAIESKNRSELVDAISFFQVYIDYMVPGSEEDRTTIGVAWVGIMHLNDWGLIKHNVNLFIDVFTNKICPPNSQNVVDFEKMLWRPDEYAKFKKCKLTDKTEVMQIFNRFSSSMMTLTQVIMDHEFPDSEIKLKSILYVDNLIKLLIVGYGDNPRALPQVIEKYCKMPFVLSGPEGRFKAHIRRCREIVELAGGCNVFKYNEEQRYIVNLLAYQKEPEKTTLKDVKRSEIISEHMDHLLKIDSEVAIGSMFLLSNKLPFKLCSFWLTLVKKVIDAVRKNPYGSYWLVR
jgi:hypothetical protein